MNAISLRLFAYVLMASNAFTFLVSRGKCNDAQTFIIMGIMMAASGGILFILGRWSNYFWEVK